MSTINLVAIAIALAAVIGLCMNLPEAWFFGLLALATMVGAAGEAYRENDSGAVGLLVFSAVLGLFAVRAAWRDGRGRAGRR